MTQRKLRPKKGEMYRARVPAPVYSLNQEEAERTPIPERVERLYGEIEKLQSMLHKRESPEAMMAMVRRDFPDPRKFLESTKFVLMQHGMKRLDAFLYASLPFYARTFAIESMGLNPCLNRVSLMGEYAKKLFIGAQEEQFYLVLLNNQGRLIYTYLMQMGTTDSAPFYLRPMLATAVKENARFIVLVHNHPGGTMRPSREDMLCTLETLNAVIHMHIPLLDHIIVAKKKVVSIRETGLIPEVLWLAAAPHSKLLKNWNDREFLTDDAPPETSVMEN